MHASRRRHRRLCWLQENIYRHPEGGGAGNNWAMGYDMAQSVQEDILEMIDREVRLGAKARGWGKGPRLGVWVRVSIAR